MIFLGRLAHGQEGGSQTVSLFGSPASDGMLRLHLVFPRILEIFSKNSVTVGKEMPLVLPASSLLDPVAKHKVGAEVYGNTNCRR